MDKILHPIVVAFAWIWVNINKGVTALGLSTDTGHGWVISIVIMTLLVRALIIPLYIKQIKSTRSMQMIQPELQKLQAKYKGKTDQASKQKQSEEMMALYKKHGTSPYASCLPMLVQMPVLFALYRVIYGVEQMTEGTYAWDHLGPLTMDIAHQIAGSKFMGVSLFESLSTTPGMGKAAFIVLIVIMVGFQFWTMWLSMKRNMPPAQDPNNPMVRSQKMMMYLMPAMFIFTGVVFKMALLVYMVTTTVFSWAQQLAVIWWLPTPGAPAYEKLTRKREAKYQEWAKPFFEDYDAKKADLAPDSDELAALQTKTLAEVKSKAKRQHVHSGFPENWTDADRLNVYRGLAMEPWKTLPDENWIRAMARSRKSQSELVNRKQPKKLTREQRMRRAQAAQDAALEDERAAERAARREAQKKAKQGTDLSPEELEKRRQERRAAQRRQGKSGKKGK